ncbi:filamentous hemagglutinin N-terminal domain-containing protein [Yersinia enterocolitica]|uniref:two-partner secretion domain-containing protein n=1 Tax=Yersinia enterocolitica TaxID=630 RepID=UPI0003005D81|nr:filamentous hemagglutinin N-terminal domain-containing protein [Yersinia enterocolitica]EKN6261320.1 filamentous hemagglutinin N-terminal domain-containing protein [Yersinia enterocolitica]HDW7096103.1 filamentous hemagglutinin N-terminal domain-containing protein [Yersinia enterocolitica]HEF7270622.1 filamentous hemagglutinin N-terminal domain-containing protein [Yersinia enterocolitica]
MNYINGDTNRRLSLLPLAVILSLCDISLSHATNIIVDKTAAKNQQANITIKPNILSLAPCRSAIGCGEKTTINIQSPDKNGLSHNKYTKFDVPHHKDVVILNNELSKRRNGNPNLVTSSATIILNEVRSSQASRLAGKVQLFGQDAHVIIANPSGIDCHGCSFTDMSHLTLTTGMPYFNRHNKLQGFKILDGDININNGIAYQSGLNHLGRGEKSAYLDLFSNTLNVDGNVTADDVFIIAGKNKIKLASAGKKMGITSLISYLSSPDYFKSVDVSDIGGIYANKIRIIAEGDIKNSNEIKSRGLIQMISRGNIKNRSGGHMTGESVQLYSINNKMKVFSYSEKIGKRPGSYTKNNDGTFSFVGKIKQSEI